MARYVDIECDAVTEILPRRAFKTRDDIQDFLNNIPTADVKENLHASWIKVEVVACSRCLKAFEKSGLYARNYCPNCGAEMDNATTIKE